MNEYELLGGELQNYWLKKLNSTIHTRRKNLNSTGRKEKVLYVFAFVTLSAVVSLLCVLKSETVS